MPLRIKSGPWPPGGFPFADPRTGQKFDGMSADLTLQARNVIQHRLANPRFYPKDQSGAFSLTGVMQEITDFVCNRNPGACFDPASNVSPRAAAPNPAAPVIASPQFACPKCGSVEWIADYCPTCSGKRVVGYICVKCGAKRKR